MLPQPADALKSPAAPRRGVRHAIELPVATASRCGIQHAPRLQRIARLRLHHQPEALQLNRVTRDDLFSVWVHSFTLLKRSALVMTDTELKLIAAPASMGLSSRPKKGYRTPAATGMPSAL